jgi:hypothetical protein
MPSPTTLVAGLLLVLLLPPAALSGRIGTGQVNGTVTDPQGAFVPGAAVKLANRDANLATRLSANSRGEEGMPLGNGRRGSLAWTSPTALKFQINRVDVTGPERVKKSGDIPGWLHGNNRWELASVSLGTGQCVPCGHTSLSPHTPACPRTHQPVPARTSQACPQEFLTSSQP